MGIFHRRPFMLCLCCFIAAAFLYDISGVGKIVIASAALLVAVVSFIISIKSKAKDTKRRFSVTAIALLFTFLSLCESFVYFDVYVADFEKYIDNDCVVECEILRNEDSSYGTTLSFVKLCNVNGNRTSGRSIIYFDYQEDLKVGTKIKLNAKGMSIDDLPYYNGRKYVLSTGVSSAFSVEDSFDAKIKIVEETPGIYVSLTSFARDISQNLANGVGGESGNFSAAILFGRRDLLSDQTTRNFERSGISHVLALSGLHMAMISGLIEFVLRKLYVPKIARCFIVVPFLIFYTAITGFSMSSLRAAIMLTVVYISFVLSNPSDSLTTVGIAGFLIVLFIPSAIMSSGFVMSLAATFGIVVVSPYLSKIFPNKRSDKHIITVIRRVGRFVLSSLIITVTANVAVLYYTWSMFGQISLATPIANLVITPIVSLQLAGAILYVIFGSIPLFGIVLSWWQHVVGNYILSAASFFSDIKGVCVSLNYGFAGVIVCALLISTAVLLIVKLKRKWLVAIPLFVSTIAFIVCISVNFLINKNTVSAEYLAFNEREMFVVSQNGETVICDISDGNYSNLYNAYKTAHEKGATEIDVLVLTHYHTKHVYSVNKLCKRQKVRNIWLPEPETEEDHYLMTYIITTAYKNGVDVCTYKINQDLNIFYDGILRMTKSEKLKRSNQPTFAFEFLYGNEKFLYVGSSAMETALLDTITKKMSDADYVVFGTHGPNPKEYYAIDAAKNVKTVVFANRELLELASASVGTKFSGEIVCDCKDFGFEMSK